MTHYTPEGSISWINLQKTLIDTANLTQTGWLSTMNRTVRGILPFSNYIRKGDVINCISQNKDFICATYKGTDPTRICHKFKHLYNKRLCFCLRSLFLFNLYIQKWTFSILYQIKRHVQGRNSVTYILLFSVPINEESKVRRKIIWKTKCSNFNSRWENETFDLLSIYYSIDMEINYYPNLSEISKSLRPQRKTVYGEG